jgi:Fur family iron response transcriptional regulator
MQLNEDHIQTANKLRQSGLRPTRQRMALARMLFENGDRHVTAELLHEEAMNAGVRVSLATVYNTLNQFTAAGLLRQVVVDTSRSYFDTNVSVHHHFLNEQNGKLTDIPPGSVGLKDLPETPDGTEITNVDIIVRIRESQ